MVIIIATCVVCNALLLANPYGLYFEDGKLFAKTAEEIASVFNGGPIFYEQTIAAVLHKYLPLTCWRALEWLLNTGTAVVFYLTLRRTTRLRPLDCLFLGLVFVAAPLYMAKISVLLVLRSMYLLLFMCGLYLGLRVMQGRWLATRLASLTLLFLALEFSGFAPLYMVALLALLHLSTPPSAGSHIRKFFIHALRHADFIALPLFSFLLKRTLTAPRGLYDNIYKVTPPEMLYASLKAVDVMVHNILGLLDTQFLLDSPFPLALVFCLCLFALSRKGHRPASREVDLISTQAVLLFSIAAMLASVFPYVVTGKPVLYTEWESRNQFLLPIGMSFFVVFSLKGLLPRRFFVPVILSLLLVFACVDNLVWASFYRDWVKQQAFAELAAGNSLVTANRDFAVFDRCPQVNALKRDINPMEYYFRLRDRLRDGEERVFHSLGSVGPMTMHGPWLNYDKDRIAGEVYICELQVRRPISLTNGSLLTLLWSELQNPHGFGKHAAEYFTLDVYPPQDLFHPR